jgi:hypothetical protein
MQLTMSLFRKDINQVFTPRSPDVNQDMYIRRDSLEKDLRRALQGSLNILIHGESGCGKSWLYKKVLAEDSIFYLPANLANASRLGSITNELQNVVARQDQAAKVEYTETKQTEGSVGLPGLGQAKGGVSHTGKYEVPQKEPLEACLQMARSLAGSRPCFVVLDNLETIFPQPKLMQELGDMVTLLDDPAYSVFKVRLLVVGIPADVREYFSRIQNRHAVSNRLQELPEVGRLEPQQAHELIRKGLCDELKISLSPGDLADAQNHVTWVTDGIPQCLHEYCLELAYLLKESDWKFQKTFLLEADKTWLKKALSKNYATVEDQMNERDTRAGRRNQVLFCLGQIQTDTFRHNDIEQILRSEFPTSTANTTLDVPGVLAQIARTKEGPIKRTSKGDSYRFTDPRFKMCIRAMLYKSGEKVAKFEFSKLR